MTNKVGIVTGAGSGIGRASALKFAEGGARVCVADRDGDAAAATVELIKSAGGNAISVECDVTETASIDRMVSMTVNHYGALHFAHNNAGVASIPGQAGTAVLCTEENWHRQIAVNLTGVWLCMRAEIPHIRQAGGGAIVITASAASLVATPGNVAYAASKHGVLGLMRTAAVEYAPVGVRINAICPGTTETAMVQDLRSRNPVEWDVPRTAMPAIPMGRSADAAEIAAVAFWLCSDEASYVTGHALAADGGYLAM